MIRLVVSAGTTLLFLFCMWALYHYVHWIHNNTDHFFSDSIRNLHLVRAYILSLYNINSVGPARR